MDFYVGLDLAAKEKNYSGLCIVNEKKQIKILNLIKSNKEILNEVNKFKVKVIAIDAPLTKAKKDRPVEKKLRELGFKPLSLKLKSMQDLAERALKLKKRFEKRGIKVIETLPSAIKIKNKKIKNKHLNDAFKAALVACAYAENKAKSISKIFLI